MTPDDELMAALRGAAAHHDPVPDQVLRAARAALSTRDVDGELIALLLDSDLVDTGRLRSSASDVRLLSFESGQVSVELQVEYANGLVSLRGLVTGTQDAVVLRTGDGERTVSVDEEGWFDAPGLPRGPLRLQVGRDARTSWITL